MANKIIVTTGDFSSPYEVLGLVYFQVSNVGVFSNHYDMLTETYEPRIADWLQKGLMTAVKKGMFGGISYYSFEASFYIGVEELKRKCRSLGGDAVICVREDMDVLDGGNFAVQMYGTAVRFVR